ncbi:SdrD B-like domain-containing protein [Actinosynnema sp. NPDC020468]|uniref:SdrD B-like domain-containing protein n=1 Tax=Actinosynnema sp. NPDC020468 TaxID=3154488 RepID=UPI0033F2D710
MTAPAAEAAVVRPFTLNFNKDLYGDFIEVANGNMRCPVAGTDPVDPSSGEPIANCATAMGGTLPTTSSGNDAYYMRWADVDSDAATFNSTTASLTIPPGATVDYARLNWAGDTGTIRLSDGTVSTTPGCTTRQFFAGAGTSVLPSGTPESTSVRLSATGGSTIAVSPQVISRDALANVPASQPQFYSAYANVTSYFQGLATGTPLSVGLGNVWTPQGFGCFGGWSLVLVYEYPGPTPVYAPGKREIFLYDGHVRQSSTDAATTTTVNGFRVAATGVRVGLTAYEGDRNISGDQFSINGTPVAEPLPGGLTTNYFVSNAQNALSPAVVNNMSVDAKQFTAPSIVPGSTSATLTFSTSGDTYLAENLVLSVPIPALKAKKELVTPGPFRPGQPVTFRITVVSPGGANAVGVAVADPGFPDCARTVGNLVPDVPVTYDCVGPAGADNFVNTANATGSSNYGDPVDDSAGVPVDVINPAVSITKTADKATYVAGETITFTIGVTNTGDTDLTGLVVADPKVAACATTRATLTAGGGFSYTCTTTAPVAGDSNTATVTALDPLGGTVTATATANAPTLGAVSGRVIADRNNNGVFDAADGDTGIGGVTVHLVGGAVNRTTTTSTDGTYAFLDVPPGTYTVTEDQPADFDDGVDTPGTNAVAAGDDAFTVTLTAGQTSTGDNFAERPTSSLAGVVYEDLDNDGSQDGGEPGLPGVTVQLTGTDSAGNAVSLTAISAPDGSYAFPALRPGLYTITETQPGTFADGKDTAGSAGGTVGADLITGITLPPRTTATGYLFGEFVGASISGRVVDDGGTGIPGVTITLTGPGGPLVLPTAADGTYSFTGLPPGTYTVTEAQPPGYADGGEQAGTSGGTVGNDSISAIALASRATASGYDFTEDRGSLAGSVYEDLDDDGTKDSGEPGIGGVTVTLTGQDALGRPVSLTRTSAPDGSYTFTGVVGGTYTVTETTQPAGYADGLDTPGSAGGTATPPDSITNVTLGGGVDATGYLFGEFKGASLAGSVVDDGGNGIGGVTVTLTGPGGPLTQLTAPDGTYQFTGLAPGTYAVAEQQPAGYGDGPDTPGSAGGDVGADQVTNIVLTSGATATGYRFEERRGSLAGVVYEDVDNDGTQDGGEPGIGGVTVTLTGQNAQGGAVNVTTTTAPDGTYSFTGVVGGTYTVTEAAQPTGYADGKDTAGSVGGTPVEPDTITGVALGGGDEAAGYLFGEFKAASISGAVVDDAGNGVPGVTVTLTGPGGPYTRTTGPDGSYSFDGLVPGTYTLTEQQPAGYADGPDTPGSLGGVQTNDQFANIVLPSGGTGTGYRFAEDRGSLSGVVFEDLDDDGVQDSGEPGIPGAAVQLTGQDATGAAVTLNVLSGADGSYKFDGVLGGTYTVTETTPAGYLDGKDAAGTAGGTVTGPDSVTAIGLAAGADATGYTFGEFKGASISGVVVDDAGNGVPGVTVTLDGPGGPVTQTTGPDGSYSFTGLAPGSYSVAEQQPAGYADGPDTAGSAGGDVADDLFSNIVLTSGRTADGYRFAEDRGSFAGVVFEDKDNDGAQDPGELGIPGVTVTLTGQDAAGNAVSLTTSSGPDGGYRFDGLLGGVYTVTETQPAGYLDGKDTAGTSGGTVTGPDSVTGIDFAAGADATGYTFGEFKGASLAGVVVDDAGNGVPGATITLTGPGGPFTAVTGPDGSYSFTGLAPGSYSVAEQQPAGYADGPDTPGTAGGDVANDLFSNVVLSSGQSASGYRFAEDRGSLSGVVYEDLNNNGVQDSGEPGIPGAAVQLTGQDDAGTAVTSNVVSGADGSYTFDGVLGGTYTVTETTPAGYLDGQDAAGSSGGTVTGPDSVTAIDLAPGADATGYLFGEFTAASLSGRVVDDGGNGIAGVTVTLTGPGGPYTRTTGADGTYSFTGLVPGVYALAEQQPVGYADGPDTAGTSGGDVANDQFTNIALISGATATGYRFAEDRGSFSGSVFEDLDNDGVRDSGEPGIPNAVVQLTGEDATGAAVSLSTTTGADGSYTFTGLLGGTYTVTETTPAGYLDGKDAVGTSGGTVTGPDSVVGIALEPGADATGYTFGEFKGASLAGRVVDDAGNPVAGVTITVTGPDGPVTKVTGADGTYSFTDLAPGVYTVAEQQPAGYADGPDTPGTAGGTVGPDQFTAITLSSGQSGTGYQFAEDRGSFSGVVFEDEDNDGIREPGEDGVAGVAVTLTGQDAVGNAVSLTTTTGPDGAYRFDGLLGGTYTVTETQPAGYLDGKDTAGTSGGTVTGPDSVTGIEFAAGADATGYTFGEVKAASLAGTVVDESGGGIGGVTVVLTGTDDLGNAVNLTAQSGPDGAFSFTGLRPGTYTVTETTPAGYGDGPDTAGTAGGTPGNDVFSGIVLASGQAAGGYRFAENRSTVSGEVYLDLNDNGTRDPGEGPVEGVTVTLTGTDAQGATVSRTTTTGADGSYSFDKVVGGVYALTETQPAGFADGKDKVGTAGGTLVSPDTITGIEVPAGGTASGYLFGEAGGVLTGTVWVDTDGDGVIDAAEAGRLAGVTVILKSDSGTEITRVSTGPDGRYRIEGLGSGSYQVVELQPDGYGSTTPNEVALTVSNGGGGNVDFGEERGSIGDFVWSDLDFDGVQDPGEPGLPGVVVTVRDSGGSVVKTTTSDKDGRYAFTDLAPGTYTVQFTAPNGKTFTTPGASDGAKNSDVDRATGLSGPVVIAIADGRITRKTDLDAGVVDRKVDLGVSISVDKPDAEVGDKVVITDRVTNTGTVTVGGATTVITVPPGLTVVDTHGDGWHCDVRGQVVTCVTDWTLEPGRTLPPVTVVTKAEHPVHHDEVVADVTLRDGTGDDNPANSRATVRVEVDEPHGPHHPGDGHGDHGDHKPGDDHQPGDHQPGGHEPGGPHQPAPQEPLAWTGVVGVLPQLLLGIGVLLVGALTVLLTARRRRGDR